MLQLTRRVGERIVIGDDIEVVVKSVSRTEVRLGISAPRSTPILRGEILERIAEANRNAVASAANRADSKAQLAGLLKGRKGGADDDRDRS